MCVYVRTCVRVYVCIWVCICMCGEVAGGERRDHRTQHMTVCQKLQQCTRESRSVPSCSDTFSVLCKCITALRPSLRRPLSVTEQRVTGSGLTTAPTMRQCSFVNVGNAALADMAPLVVPLPQAESCGSYHGGWRRGEQGATLSGQKGAVSAGPPARPDAAGPCSVAPQRPQPQTQLRRVSAFGGLPGAVPRHSAPPALRPWVSLLLPSGRDDV